MRNALPSCEVCVKHLQYKLCSCTPLEDSCWFACSQDPEDDDEIEDDTIQPSDNLFIVGRADEEFSSVEVHGVYRTSICVSVYAHVCVCVCICVYVCMFVCAHICVGMWLYE